MAATFSPCKLLRLRAGAAGVEDGCGELADWAAGGGGSVVCCPPDAASWAMHIPKHSRPKHRTPKHWTPNRNTRARQTGRKRGKICPFFSDRFVYFDGSSLDLSCTSGIRRASAEPRWETLLNY